MVHPLYPHVTESGIMHVESGILGFGVRSTAQIIRTAISNWNWESKLACVLENAILLFSPRVAFARFFKAPPWVFVWTAQPQGGGKDFSSSYQRKMANARWMRGGWARLELTEPLSPLTTAWGNYHPWRGLSPLATPGITWIISHYYTNV